MSTSILQWMQIIVSAITLICILYGAFKVVNRNNEEWRDRERRLIAIEAEISDFRRESKDITAVATTLASLQSEIERMRNRLDQFLDSVALRSGKE